MEGSNCKESLSCAGCLNDIGDDDYVSALEQNWHKDCFRCSVCDDLLSSWYFEKAGLLFCQNDYWARYGESCQQCAQVITGPVMAAGEHRFHPECFACAACGGHIEDAQPYALLERSKLYCGACYGSERQGAAHTIRLLQAPAAALRLAPDRAAYTVTDSGCGVARARCADKLSCVLRALLAACLRLACYRIDSTCGVLTLQIGDRILEINGTPVRARPHDEIERVLAKPDTVLQLTIEHNPETTHNNNNIPPPKTTIPDVEDKTKHDSKSPVERKILREDLKKSPKEEGVDEECGGRKERLFKRKGEGGDRSRVMKRRQAPASPLLGDKERSSSMSKLLDVVQQAGEGGGVLRDLSRARSFRARPAAGQTVFRAADLLQGELLGSGFFGQVYKVTHRDTNEVMVLKQLYRVDDDAQRNFLKEVAVLRSLSHKNVLRFIGVLYRDQRLHLVTEYVPGGTLHQLLQDSSEPLSWELRCRLARDVCAGVGYLHRMHVIHRDLNSHNCLVREDKTVIVADFGLARIVQRTGHLHHHRTRKRYTVVGNPYWMAPEMMNGNVYDERVDVFSFGIILCEVLYPAPEHGSQIIGRVSADPDFLPRRSDFGLNEAAFMERFCGDCPEPFYRVAFRACHLEPDFRPSFEVMEGWLERLLPPHAPGGAAGAALLQDIVQHARCGSCAGCGPRAPEPRAPRAPRALQPPAPHTSAIVKSQSNASIAPTPCPAVGRRALPLGKCVSASHIAAVRPTVTLTKLSRSQNTLYKHAPGYILSSTHTNINITKVDDITEWLDPPAALKRSSPPLPCCLPPSPPPAPAPTLAVEHKSRRLAPPPPPPPPLPAFLRNQSVEELETEGKHPPSTGISRHHSVPDHCQATPDNSDSDDDELSPWTHFMDVDKPKNFISDIVKKGENLLAKKSSYDVVTLRNPACLTDERKIPEEDYRRYNINHLTKSPIMAEGIKNIPKTIEVQKPAEKTNFFSKKLLSPKFSRLFKPNTSEVVRNKNESDENKEEKSRSKFFIQRPASPSNIGRSYRVRPLDDSDRKLTGKKDSDVLKSDLKLASLGKPMTPIFRRHIPTERPEFADGRFSYRDRRGKYDSKGPEGKFIELGRNRIKAPIIVNKLAPLIRSSQMNNIPGLTTVVEKDKPSIEKDVKKREPGISRSNYVSLANLKINSKSRDLEPRGEDKRRGGRGAESPLERVI